MKRGVDSIGGVGRLMDVRMVLHAKVQERHAGIMERAAVASSADTTTASSGLVTPAT